MPRPADKPSRVPAVRFVWSLVSLAVAACITAPIEPTLQFTDSSTPTLSPTALLAPTPSPAAARSPDSPQSTPTPDPTTLHVDGMATVAQDRVGQVVDPAHPDRNKRLNRLLGPLEVGQRVFLVDGPRDERGIEWWQATTGSLPLGPNLPLGWVKALGRDGPNLVPHQPFCPPTDGPLGVERIGRLTSFE